MTDKDSAEASRALLKFCRSLFETSNLIGTDFKDASILEVKRPFVQPSDEGGLHVQFTVSWGQQLACATMLMCCFLRSRTAHSEGALGLKRCLRNHPVSWTHAYVVRGTCVARTCSRASRVVRYAVRFCATGCSVRPIGDGRAHLLMLLERAIQPRRPRWFPALQRS